MRDWKKFDNDEIMSIWKSYIAQDFGNADVLRMKIHQEKPIRLTPIEIIRLVDELMERLDFIDKCDES